MAGENQQPLSGLYGNCVVACRAAGSALVAHVSSVRWCEFATDSARRPWGKGPSSETNWAANWASRLDRCNRFSATSASSLTLRQRSSSSGTWANRSNTSACCSRSIGESLPFDMGLLYVAERGKVHAVEQVNRNLTVPPKSEGMPDKSTGFPAKRRTPRTAGIAPHTGSRLIAGLPIRSVTPLFQARTPNASTLDR